jgi:hypothetical protein
VDALVSPLSTIILKGALHAMPVLCFLPEEGDEASHCAFALPMTHSHDFFAESSFLVAEGESSLVPAVRSLPDRVGDVAFDQVQRLACPHFASGFDRAHSQRVMEFIDNSAVPEKPVKGTPRGPS